MISILLFLVFIFFFFFPSRFSRRSGNAHADVTGNSRISLHELGMVAQPWRLITAKSPKGQCLLSSKTCRQLVQSSTVFSKRLAQFPDNIGIGACDWSHLVQIDHRPSVNLVLSFSREIAIDINLIVGFDPVPRPTPVLI